MIEGALHPTNIIAEHVYVEFRLGTLIKHWLENYLIAWNFILKFTQGLETLLDTIVTF